MTTHDHGVDEHQDGPESAQRNIHAELERKKAKLAKVAAERDEARYDERLLRDRYRKVIDHLRAAYHHASRQESPEAGETLREAVHMALVVDELMGE